MSNTYAVGYSVSLFEKSLAEQDPSIKRRIEQRRLTADRHLNQKIYEMSKKQEQPHRVVVGKWECMETPLGIEWQKKAKLVFTHEVTGGHSRA